MKRVVKFDRKHQGAQATVEFALTILIFMMTVLGIIEFSRLFLVYSSVYTASREAARYGSSVGDYNSLHYQDCDGIKQVAVNMGFFGGVKTSDVDVYYESTPGASADRLETCTDATTKYNAKLGDRIVVGIQVTFKPILGIVPEIPIKTSNGRTIMMDIKVDATPMPKQLCHDYVYFADTGPKVGATSNILYREIINNSTVSHFMINSITNINWNSAAYPAKLQEIHWDNNKIWFSEDPAGNLPVINITEDYWKEYNRNLPAKTTTLNPIKLEFVFDQPVDQADFNLVFTLKMQSSSVYEDYCDPVN